MKNSSYYSVARNAYNTKRKNNEVKQTSGVKKLCSFF